MTPLVTIVELRDAIVETLANYEKSYELPGVCEMLGLGSGSVDDAHRSKRVYIRTRLTTRSMPFLLDLADKVLERYPQETDLENMVRLFRASGLGVAGEVKNIIFSADGPKPELILADAVNNQIEIVTNSEYCLVYDLFIPSSGLTWIKLVEWWSKRQGLPFPERSTEYDLFYRLKRSLASPPEKILFDTYFRVFHSRLGDSLPALIPQVYLHFDPKTIKELEGSKRIPRQRMDFLLLFSSSARIVIEVDGKQHYSDDDISSPRKYADMVSEDRKLRLKGYEIYRFGGYELDKSKGPSVVEQFFQQLFERHRIKPNDKI